jgi:lysophospholipase L1-like esterase
MSQGTIIKERSSRLSNIGKNVLLLLLSLIFVLGVCEIALRVYNPLGFRIKGNKIILPRNRTEIIHHEGGGKLEKVVVHRKNSLGFRGPDPPVDFAARLTVVTVGGSTTESFELPEEQTWPHLLGLKLRQDCPRAWLNNAGLSGYSTFGHIILLQDYLLTLHPRVIIFLVGINDIGVKGAREYDTRLKLANFRSLERTLATLANYSEVAAAALNLYRYYFPKSVMAVAARKMGEIDLKSYGQLEVAPEARAALKREQQEKYLAPFRERVQTLIALSRSRGIEPVFLTQPVLYGNAVDEVSGVDLRTVKVTPEMNGKVAWEVLELYNDVIREVGKQEGVLVIDVAQELPQNSRYYYDLMHYTQEGSARMAEIIHTRLGPWLVRKFPNFCSRAVP